MYTPIHLKLWTHPTCYVGAEWPEYYVVVGQHRDSDTVTRCNFEEIKSDLEAEITKLGLTHVNEGSDNEEPFLVNPYESHWAVGHVEWLGLHKDSPESLLQFADNILQKLEDYPVYNEDKLSELKSNEANECWAQLPLRERIEICSKNRISIFAARRDYIPQDDNGNIQEYCLGN